MLTCQSDIEILVWEVVVTDPSVNVNGRTFAQPDQSAVGQTHTLSCGAQTTCPDEYQFVATLTDIAPVTSTLTTTANNALDGTVVECRSTGSPETVTLQIISEL